DDGSAFLWRGREGRSLDGGSTPAASVAVSSRWLAWSDPEAINIRAADGEVAARMAIASNVELAFLGERLLFAANDELRICDPGRCQETAARFAKVDRAIQTMTVSADSVAVSTASGTMYLFDAHGGTRASRALARGDLLYLALSRDGKRLASAD